MLKLKQNFGIGLAEMQLFIPSYVSKRNRRAVYRFVFGKPEGQNSRSRRRLRWDNTITMDCSEIGWERLDWIDLAQNKNTLKALFTR
jgi:hypothetical protein